MKTLSLTLGVVALLLGFTSGQATYNHTVPAGYETVDGNYSSSWPFNVASTQRWQFVYDWTQLYHQCPQTIVQLAFRPNSAASLVNGGVYPGVSITLSSSLTDHATFSGVFANNLDTDATLVYQGDLTVPLYVGGGAGAAPFNVVVPFSTPFEFDPTRQKDLIVDISTPGANPTGVALIWDGVFPTTIGGRHGHITDPNSATANWQNHDAVPVLELQYFLGSTSHFSLTAQSASQSLFVQFTNIPATTTDGYTLLSSLPAPVFGKGPLFGLFPNFFTFDIILRPMGLGDPLHWTYPAGGTFPDIPLALPSGAMAQFIGQTWEFAGVAVGAGGQVAGITAPQSVTF